MIMYIYIRIIQIYELKLNKYVFIGMCVFDYYYYNLKSHTISVIILQY